MRTVLNWGKLTPEKQETTLAYLNACRILREAGALPNAVRKRGNDKAR